ncbi:MAG: hypothetical protein LUI13_14935 [Lachnospiraceae bacterium]|nr:hypothetical protein [Lachnospiraceae bacterium]
MKRCNVCGNIGDDECTVCSICGNPLTEADVIAEQDEDTAPVMESEPDLTVTAFEQKTEKAAARESAGSNQNVDGPIRDAAVSAKIAEASAKAAAESARAAAASAKIAEASAKVVTSMPEVAASNEAAAEKEVRTADQPEASVLSDETESAAEDAASAVQQLEEMAPSVKQPEDMIFAAQESEGPAFSAQRPEDTASFAQQPEGAAFSAQRPEDTASFAQELEGPAFSAQRPENTASFAQESEGPAFSAQRPENTASFAQQPEGAAFGTQRSEDTASSVKQPEGASFAQRPARTRRTRGGPQIYGQDAMSGYNGAQGVIRRDVQGGHMAGDSQDGSGTGSGMNRTGRDTAASRRAVRGTNSQAQNRPSETGSVYAPQGEPAKDMRQSRSVKAQPNPAGGPANAQTGAAGNRASAPGQPQRTSVPPYAQVSQGDRQQAIKITTARKVIETALDALASPMLIIIALFYTVYFVSNIAAIFLRQLNFSQIARLLTLINFPSQLSGYISMFQAAMAWLDKGALALNLLIRVPELLFCVGLWLLIVLVRTADEQMSGVGFLLLKISVIITMIAACGILLVVLVVSVTLVIAAWSAGTQSLIVVAVVTLIATIAVTMAVLMYYFCYLATIKTVRRSARTGEPYGKASAYVAVIHIIFAFTAIINILSGIVNLEITGITAGAGQIGWMVLFGIWILRYRSSMSEYAE